MRRDDTTEKLIKVLRWREALEGEFVQCEPDWTRTHCGFDMVGQDQLDIVTLMGNAWWNAIGSQLRIGNHNGQILPARVKPNQINQMKGGDIANEDDKG